MVTSPSWPGSSTSEGLSATWSHIHVHAHDPERFDRNLERLLDGIEHDLATP